MTTTFLHPVTLIGPAGEATVQALVGTDSLYTWVPRPLLEGLGIAPDERREFERADGSLMEPFDRLRTGWTWQALSLS